MVGEIDHVVGFRRTQVDMAVALTDVYGRGRVVELERAGRVLPTRVIAARHCTGGRAGSRRARA